LLGGVTVGAALLILVSPGAYPPLFIAITCLLARAAGAVVAAFLSGGEVRVWVLGRALVDLTLGGILLAAAPLAAIVSIISGNRWPDRAGAVLTNFVAVSMLATGIAMLGLALRSRHGDIDPADDPALEG
jgi:CBS-domain-containing membrane protein